MTDSSVNLRKLLSLGIVLHLCTPPPPRTVPQTRGWGCHRSWSWCTHSPPQSRTPSMSPRWTRSQPWGPWVWHKLSHLISSMGEIYFTSQCHRLSVTECCSFRLHRRMSGHQSRCIHSQRHWPGYPGHQCSNTHLYTHIFYGFIMRWSLTQFHWELPEKSFLCDNSQYKAGYASSYFGSFCHLSNCQRSEGSSQ